VKEATGVLAGDSAVKTASSPVALTAVQQRLRDLSCMTGTQTTSSPVSLTGGDALVTSSSQKMSLGASGALLSPVTGGMIAGIVVAGFSGVSNAAKYARNEKSGAAAVKDTAKVSTGAGVATGLGIVAAKAVAGSALGLALGTAALVPIAAGVATAGVSIHLWNKVFGSKD